MENRKRVVGRYHKWCAAVLLMLCTVATSWAQDVSYAQARDIATDFFKSRGIAVQSPRQAAPRRSSSAMPRENEPYYIFNDEQASAFVIVSGDSRTQQVLAYSTEGAFDESNIAPGAQYMLQMYEDYIGSIQGVDIAAAPRKAAPASDGKGKRLYTAEWNQTDRFWWEKCPMLGNQPTHAGCVATAMAIIMRYHEWPASTGYGSKTYTWNGIDLTADFGATDYGIATLPTGNEWDDTWTDDSKDRVSTLLHHCGVAVEMNYGTDGSGASTDNAMTGLWRYFGYNQGYSLLLSDTNYEAWLKTVKKEIDAGYPMIYDGQNSDDIYAAGHAFICEGYDSEDHLYFNFGWSGWNNGYYAIVEPLAYEDGDGLHEYSYNQKAYVGIRPYKEDAPQTFCDLRMEYDETGTGLRIERDKFLEGGYFNVSASMVTCVSDKTQGYLFAIGLHKADGTNSIISYYNSGINAFPPGCPLSGIVALPCIMPQGYTVSEGDYVYFAYSTDGGETWNEASCIYPKRARIMVAELYDDNYSNDPGIPEGPGDTDNIDNPNNPDNPDDPNSPDEPDDPDTPDEPLEYENEIVVNEGWTWLSTFIDKPLTVDSLFENGAVRVLSQTQESISDPSYGVVGNLDSMLPCVGYKVNSAKLFSFSRVGAKCDMENNPVALKKGWNWIGYPGHKSREIGEVIANAEEGDFISSQFGFAEFANGEWKGDSDPFELEPGAGYLYRSASDKTLEFDFSKPAKASGRTDANAGASHTAAKAASRIVGYGINPYKYPSTMNVVAQLLCDGTVAADSRYAVKAYCGDELRGVGTCAGGMCYITVYGDQPVEIRFVAEDTETGETMAALETLPFRSDAIGSSNSPFALTIGEATGVAHAAADAGNGSEAIYTVSGVRVENTSRPGIYINRGRKVVVR